MAENRQYFERVYKDATTGNHTVPDVADGKVLVASAGSDPAGTVVSGEDNGITTTATCAFSSIEATAVLCKLKQTANAGAAQQYGVVYVVFNSSDAVTDLTDATIRRAITVGDEAVFSFPKSTPCTVMDYKSSNNSADLTFYWEYK